MIDYAPRFKRRPRLRAPELGDVVEVYRNLNKPGGPWYSVRRSGVVVGHVRAITLSAASFVVRESGRQRVLATGRKNVHAWIKGTIASDDAIGSSWLDVRYDPRRWATFVDGAGQARLAAPLVTISAHGLACARF